MEKYIITLIERYTNTKIAGSDNEMYTYGLSITDISDIISNVEEFENITIREVDEEKLLQMNLSEFISWVKSKVKS